MSKLRNLSKMLESIFIALTFIPLYLALFAVLLILGIPSLILRFIVEHLAKVIHPEWVGLMTGKDVVVGADDLQRPRNVLLWYNTLDGRVSLQEISRNFLEFVVERRVRGSGELMYPKYKQFFEPWWGYNFWQWDTTFDIRNHVKLLPGSSEVTVTTEDQVMVELGRQISAPFQPKRPYWECLVVPNYLPKGIAEPKTLVIYRMHHGIGDGYSFLKSFMQHLCNDDLAKMVTLKDPVDRSRGPLSRILSVTWLIMQVPYRLMRQCLVDIDRNDWFLSSRDLTGQCHVAQTGQISIAAIKGVCKKFDVTFTSVLFSALAGGIRKHFKLQNAGDKKLKMPSVLRCFTPFPWRNHPNNTLINHWTCASVPLFLGIDSVQERMERTEACLQELKKSPIPLANHLLLPFGATFPVWMVRFGNWFNSAIVSNFPGPKDHVHYYKRYTVEDLNFWAPHLNGRAGIGITMISYGPVMRFGFNFDKGILPRQQDLDDIAFYVEQELTKLFDREVTEPQLFPASEKVVEDAETEVHQRLNTKLLRHRSVS